jgi:hypothetical protein
LLLSVTCGVSFARAGALSGSLQEVFGPPAQSVGIYLQSYLNFNAQQQQAGGDFFVNGRKKDKG